MERNMKCIKIGSPSLLKGLAPCQILGKLTRQRKNESYEVFWQAGLEMTGRKFFSKTHEERYHEELVAFRAPQGH